MIARLLRRRSERVRVDAFLAAIAVTRPAPVRPMPVSQTPPVPHVEPVAGREGVWQLDEASRARLHTDTALIPRVILTASAPLR